jgi:GT2 family glycosyltransferase
MRRDHGVTVVVVAFHRPAALQALLAGLEGMDVVVVNVQADPEVSRAAARQDVRVIDIDGNPGYAAAVNAGSRVVDDDRDVVVFMNDDVLISAEAVELLAAAVAAGEADVAVPALVDEAGVPERTIAGLPTPRRLAGEWALLPDAPVRGLRGVVPVQKWRSPSQPERIDAAAATVVATRRDLLLAQPLPETYFLYWEECEWFWHLRERGARVLYRPDIVASHRGGRVDVRPEKSRLLARNAVVCVRRTQGRMAAAIAVPIVVLWNARLLLVALVRRRFVAARWAGLMAACGSWSAVR